MNNKFCVTEKSKCILLVFSFLFFISIIFYFWRLNILWANANPDYICKKTLTGQSCNYTEANCDAWTSDWKRVCHGTRNNMTYYYNRRTTCAWWYTWQQLWDSAWDSWRTSWDYYSTENCIVILEDHIAPIWEIK